MDWGRVPSPTPAEPDESVLGASFYLMDAVDGFIAGTDMPRLHAGDPDIRQRMGLSFANAASALGAVGEWMERNCTKTITPGLIHGDLHLGNVMLCHDSPDAAAVLDWELTAVGDPLAHVGGILAMWPDPDERSALLPDEPWHGFPTAWEFVDRYRLGSERDMLMIEWEGVPACFKTGIVLEGTNARAIAGFTPKEIGDMHRAVTVGLFECGRSIITTLS